MEVRISASAAIFARGQRIAPLTQLTDGDLAHRMDFRSLYATAAHRFMGVKPDFLGYT